MAFDLVHYFSEQIKIQKPELLSHYTKQEQYNYLKEVNVLSLSKLIQLARKDRTKLYEEIKNQDPLYIQELARHLTTSPHNASQLSKTDLEQSLTTVLGLQFLELKQLDETGNLGEYGILELLVGQIEHLSGQADDWVWTTNELTELRGSKPSHEDTVSLQETMKEFNQMVHQHAQEPQDLEHTQAVEAGVTPTWAKILEPLVAVVILWVLYCAAANMFM